MSFSKDFLWGVATASYQVEGAYNIDGKGVSIWDVFSKEEGKILNGHNGDVAVDQYHLYEKDIKLMAELGVKTYRFSVSWTRIIPNGVGEVNKKGVEYYNNLIDMLLKYNITPLLTLFHWDYPYELERKGAWLNQDSPKWFADYAKVLGEKFGDRVKYFITFNEPQCFISLGYLNGINAPGKKLPVKDIVVMAHNVMLAHGLAVKELRRIVPDAKIGYAPTSTPRIPNTESLSDIEAAKKSYFDIDSKCFTWCVTWWSDPVMLGRYPEETEVFKTLEKYLPKNYKEDLKTINQPLDFYGQNIYHGSVVYAKGDDYDWVNTSPNQPYTSYSWPVTPKALYWGPKFLYERYKKPILITENGMADLDFVCLDGKVHDPNRIDYLHRYLRELKKVSEDGVEIMGYTCWSILDNLEWAQGFTKRFGLIYVDFETQERIPKDSFYWYKKVIENNGANL